WQRGLAPAGSAIRFHTRSGLLTARPRDRLIELDFPAEPPEPAPPVPGLAKALGAEVLGTHINRLGYLVELADAEVVRNLWPDFPAPSGLPVRSVTVTAAGDGGVAFVSRFFAPACGIAEDPVTGSAHCGLGPFWAARLRKAELRGYQASPRGGEVGVRV